MYLTAILYSEAKWAVFPGGMVFSHARSMDEIY